MDIKELIERCEKAIYSIRGNASYYRDTQNKTELARVNAKIEGVEIALSYIREYAKGLQHEESI